MVEEEMAKPGNTCEEEKSRSERLSRTMQLYEEKVGVNDVEKKFEKETEKRIAKRMLRNGESNAYIMKFTELTLSELQVLQSQVDKE